MGNESPDLDHGGLAQVVGKVTTLLGFFALIALLCTGGLLGALRLTNLSANQDFAIVIIWFIMVMVVTAAVVLKKPSDLVRVETDVLKALVESGGLKSAEETLSQREHQTEQEGDEGE